MARRQRRTILIAAAALAVPSAVLLFAWSGIYNVAASRGHWPVMEWFLTFGMRNSVETHAIGIKAPALDDINMVRLGAAHFVAACAPCHGAPGVPPAATTQHTLPPPPDLSSDMRPWRDRELFWIIKNGLKYTAMPAWPAENRDDEVWALVAFLKKLSGLSAQAFDDLSSGGFAEGDDRRTGARDDKFTAIATTLQACARCHGDGARGPSSNLVPVLHGQPAGFIAQALGDFSAGHRSSGIMMQASSNLTREQIERLAAYYSALPPIEAATSGHAAAMARGRALAENGDAGARIPACTGCHGADALTIFPRLSGQSAVYMQSRLRFWQSRTTPTTDSEAIMLPIARLLSAAQIEDVSTFFAAQTAAGRKR